MTELNSQGIFDIVFSDFIQLYKGAAEWSSENIGANFIKIELELSESTLGILYEEDISSIGLSWKVV